MRSILLWAGLAIGVLSACRPEAPINGIGGFEIDKTQLGSLSGRCMAASEEPLMLCPSIASVMLDKQSANIDLYFSDDTADAPLGEILLDVPGCDPEALKGFLAGRLGPAAGRSGNRAFWQNKYIFISAALPKGPSRCEVNFVSINDQARIKRLGGPAPEKK